MKSEIEKCKDLFESILCLCSEGPEFYSKLELMDTIIKEASKGYGICKSHQPEDSADTYSDPGGCKLMKCTDLINERCYYNGECKYR